VAAAARHRITLLPLPSATLLTPSLASILGGTSVRFPLSFNTSGVALLCRFRSAETAVPEEPSLPEEPSVPVLFVDASGGPSSASNAAVWGMCRAPMHAPGVVRVQVFAEGSAVMEAELLYIRPLVMRWLEPSAGSAETGTLVSHPAPAWGFTCSLERLQFGL